MGSLTCFPPLSPAKYLGSEPGADYAHRHVAPGCPMNRLPAIVLTLVLVLLPLRLAWAWTSMGSPPMIPTTPPPASVTVAPSVMPPTAVTVPQPPIMGPLNSGDASSSPVSLVVTAPSYDPNAPPVQLYAEGSPPHPMLLPQPPDANGNVINGVMTTDGKTLILNPDGTVGGAPPTLFQAISFKIRNLFTPNRLPPNPPGIDPLNALI